jgi:hypothetical protein
MACSKHQLVLHLLLVVELLLQLQKTRMLKALLHLARPGLLLMAMPPFSLLLLLLLLLLLMLLLLLLQKTVVFWLLAGGAR